MTQDWAGLAILVAALAAAFVSVGTFVRQGTTEKKQDALAVKAEEIHKLTNSNYSDLNARLDQALAEIRRLGEAANVEAEANRGEREAITGLAVEQARAAEPRPAFDEGMPTP